MEFSPGSSIILLSGRLPPAANFYNKGDPMETWKPTPLRLNLGRGGGGGGHGGGGFGRGGFGGRGEFERFGIMTERAPLENLCGPNSEIGEDGRCHHESEKVIVRRMMGQTKEVKTAYLGEPWSTLLGRTAAVVGVAGVVTQFAAKKGSTLHTIGGYGEIFAITYLAYLTIFGQII